MASVSGQCLAARLGRESGVPRVLYGVRLSFADGSFDTVLLAFVLPHCPDPGAVLREAARVSQRVPVLEDGDGSSPPGRIKRPTDALIHLKFDHPHGGNARRVGLEPFVACGLGAAREQDFTSHPGGSRRHRLYVLERL